MRLILIAAGLIDMSGHHYMEARAFKETATQNGQECTILAHREIKDTIRDELGALPLFQLTPYQRLFHKWWLGQFLDFRVYGQMMCRELLNLNPGMVSASDVLVSTLTKARDMQGLALWLSRIPREKRPFVAINFMIDDISKPGSKTGEWRFRLKPALLYRVAFSRLRQELGNNRLLLSAGSTTFAQAMTRILGHPVLSFPIPVQHDLPTRRIDNTSAGKPPLIVFLGHMRKEKGADLIGSVIARVLEQSPDCRFLLQANPEGWEHRWRQEIGPIGAARVDIHRGEMTQDEYQDAMNRADLVLLPYNPAGYALQTSGIFSEAMAMERISVIPEGTWMADMSRKYGGGAVIFPRFEETAMAAAVCRALQGLPDLTRDMGTISSRWRESMGMKTFLQRILDAARPSDAASKAALQINS
ncbi:MAG: glycosyltransferase [Syntrophotaleaceae bacterium]